MTVLNSYKDSGLLFNNNFLDETSQSGTFAYRGELVLLEGEVADAKGHVKPPVEVMRGVVILAGEKIDMIVGAIDQASSINTFVEKYQSDFAEIMLAVLYVVNIEKEVQVNINGVNFVLIPLEQGVPWNEIIDELALEKSDFKGQSSADKVLTLFEELKSYQPKYPESSLDDVLASATDKKREGWGSSLVYS